MPKRYDREPVEWRQDDEPEVGAEVYAERKRLRGRILKVGEVRQALHDLYPMGVLRCIPRRREVRAWEWRSKSYRVVGYREVWEVR